METSKKGLTKISFVNPMEKRHVSCSLHASSKIWRRACSARRRFRKLRLRSCEALRREPRKRCSGAALRIFCKFCFHVRKLFVTVEPRYFAPTKRAALQVVPGPWEDTVLIWLNLPSTKEPSNFVNLSVSALDLIFGNVPNLKQSLLTSSVKLFALHGSNEGLHSEKLWPTAAVSQRTINSTFRKASRNCWKPWEHQQDTWYQSP